MAIKGRALTYMEF